MFSCLTLAKLTSLALSGIFLEECVTYNKNQPLLLFRLSLRATFKLNFRSKLVEFARQSERSTYVLIIFDLKCAKGKVADKPDSILIDLLFPVK
jgi:hypothetical protein